MENPYKFKLTKKYIEDKIKEGGCYCTKHELNSQLKKIKLSRKTKAELWEQIQSTNWASC